MSRKKTPFQLGYEAYGTRDAECPFGQHDEDTAFIEWHDGYECAEEKASDEFAQYCDPSMRDLYE